MTETLLDFGKAVKLVDLRDFLRLKGWAPAAHRNERIELFRPQRNDLPPVEFVLPRSAEAADFAHRVVDAATTLGTLLRLSPEAVIAQMRDLSKDVLNTRLVSEDAESDSIPLDLATRTVEGLKKLLTYAATGEASSLPFFTRPTAKAVQHAQQCRFGHTFRGSFGFTVESPLMPLQENLMDDFPVHPYERRVFERVYRALMNVQQAKREKNLSPVVSNYETGMNANMCDALLEMSEPRSNRRLAFSIHWSPKIPEDAPKESVWIDSEALEYIKAASRELRQLEESRDVTIEGRVVLLKSDSQPWEDEPNDEHTVVIAWLDEGGKAVKTRVVLSPENYLAACKAHMEGRVVSVAGRLEKRGKYTRLLNPQRFGPARQGSLFS